MEETKYASFTFRSDHENELDDIAEGIKKTLRYLGLSVEVEASRDERNGEEEVKFDFVKHSDRICDRCDKEVPNEGPDPCIGNLPGVSNACCGHGDPAKAYVQFTNGIVLRGFYKIEPDKIKEN